MGRQLHPGVVIQSDHVLRKTAIQQQVHSQLSIVFAGGDHQQISV